MERVYGEGNLCAGGSCKSSPQAESRVCAHSRLMQLRKQRNKSKKEPVWRSSTGASGLLKMTAWRIEVAPFPDLLNVATPTKAIITIPITLYMDMGMVLIREKGVPRDAAMGGSMGVQARQSSSL